MVYIIMDMVQKLMPFQLSILLEMVIVALTLAML